jgi:hypothetical protein
MGFRIPARRRRQGGSGPRRWKATLLTVVSAVGLCAGVITIAAPAASASINCPSGNDGFWVGASGQVDHWYSAGQYFTAPYSGHQELCRVSLSGGGFQFVLVNAGAATGDCVAYVQGGQGAGIDARGCVLGQLNESWTLIIRQPSGVVNWRRVPERRPGVWCCLGTCDMSGHRAAVHDLEIWLASALLAQPVSSASRMRQEPRPSSEGLLAGLPVASLMDTTSGAVLRTTGYVPLAHVREVR